MAFNSFNVTEFVYNFTATVTTPLELALTGTDTHLTVVTPTTATISVVNTRQPITISGLPAGGGGGAGFDQNLNTTDSVNFATVTTPYIYGTAGQPVTFPTGISAANAGTIFTGGLDFGGLFGTYTNVLSLLFAALPIDMGTIVYQPQYSMDMGTL